MLPAVALNVAVVEPAGTVTVEAGTGSNVLLLEMATDVPPLGAAWFKVRVQVVLTPELKPVGLHTKEDIVIGTTRLTVDV